MKEIAARYQRTLEQHFHGDQSKVSKMAIIWNGEVRMANLCVCACYAVNGVSALHSDILKKDVFHDAYTMRPEQFKNVTNGVDHRRWLSQINPKLDALVKECTGGDDYLLHPEAIRGLEKYKDDQSVLAQLEAIKKENKRRFAAYVARESGVQLNTDAVFDVQVKRLHEYKRQLLNVLHIIHLYNQLRDNPNMEFTPQTFLFGAKAAPGYHVAKKIIQLINSLSAQINADPICKDKLQVVFLENYRVSLAEKLMPASEISEQISTAGKEASGTGNMKFMMNGALTIGTLDCANVEMHQQLGDEKIFLFGLTADQGRIRAISPPTITTATRPSSGCWIRSAPALATVWTTTTLPTGSWWVRAAARPTSTCSWPTLTATARPTAGPSRPTPTASSGTRCLSSTSPVPASSPPTGPSGITPAISGTYPPVCNKSARRTPVRRASFPLAKW